MLCVAYCVLLVRSPLLVTSLFRTLRATTRLHVVAPMSSYDELPPPVASLSHYQFTPEKDTGAAPVTGRTDPSRVGEGQGGPKPKAAKKATNDRGFVVVDDASGTVTVGFSSVRKVITAAKVPDAAARLSLGDRWLARLRAAHDSGEHLSVKDSFLDQEGAPSAAASRNEQGGDEESSEDEEEESEEEASDEEESEEEEDDDAKGGVDGEVCAAASVPAVAPAKAMNAMKAMKQAMKKTPMKAPMKAMKKAPMKAVNATKATA
jgi:hypothetical protein